MKLKLIVIILLFHVTVKAQTYSWLKQITGIGSTMSSAMNIDRDGNVYLVGTFTDTCTIDSFVINYAHTGINDLFLVKIDSNGHHQFNFSLGATGYIDCYNIEIDKQGNFFLTGFFYDSIDFDPGPNTYQLKSNFGPDGYLAKYDSNGKFIWVRQFTSKTTSTEYPIASCLDDSGNIYMIGGFSYSMDADPDTSVHLIHASPNARQKFVSKLNNDGKFIWVKQSASILTMLPSTIKYHNNKIYFTGSFTDSCTMDPSGSNNKLYGSDLTYFLSKMNLNGGIEFIKPCEGFGTWGITDLTLDTEDNIYLAGYYTGLVDFNLSPDTFLVGGGGLNTGGGTRNIFFSKSDSTGKLKWVNAFPQSNNQDVEQITIDKNNDLYVAGKFLNYIDFDPGPDSALLVGTGFGGDVFFGKYDHNGKLIWVHKVGNGSQAFRPLLKITPAYEIYFGGSFGLEMDFDFSTFIQSFFAPLNDGFILKMHQPFPLRNIESSKSEDHILIYPNPAREYLHLKYDHLFSNTSYKIYNYLGQAVLQGSLTQDKRIDLSSMKDGNYFIRFQNNSKQLFGFKFIKE